MSTELNVFLGICFVLLAFSTTLLMYHLWGYPFDTKKHRSSAPRWAMNLHRVLGWAFVLIYLYLMIQMIPRMWTYQIELPARTVLHLVIGFSIGGLLLCKILIVRFFKHLESTLAPALGTTIFVLTLTLLGLALPLVWREQVLSRQAFGSEGISEERLQRVSEQLPSIGLEDEDFIAELTTTRGLISGRKLLRSKCVQCHDLRTILARPRTAKGWHDTVERMASRATIVSSFNEEEKWRIVAYLIAITPTLQNAIMQRTATARESTDTAEAMGKASDRLKGDSAAFDVTAAEKVFLNKCSQCHVSDLALIRTFSSSDEISQLISRMIGNGLVASSEELEQIARYLQQHHDLVSDASDSKQSSVAATTEEVQMPALANEFGCSGCHQIDLQVVGPAWKDVATRYRDDDDARNKLIEKVKVGGSGNWDNETGGVPMPASPAVNEQQIAELVDFILALEK